MNRLRLTLLTLFSLVLTATVLAQGTRTASCGCGTPGTLPIAWDIRHTDPAAQQAAQQAFGLWNNYVDVHRATVGSNGAFDVGNGRNEILFFDFSSVPGFDPTTVGIMLSLPETSFGQFNACPVPAGTACGNPFFEMDVLISSSIDWHVNRPNIDDPRDAGYYQSTAVHEIGHGMGFHHNFKNVSTMNYYQDFAGQYVTRADVLAARQQFPSRTKNLTDLATYPFSYDANKQTSSNGTVAVKGANVNVTSVAPGGKIVINNWTMENLGTSSVNAQLRFYLSADKTITTSDILIGGYRWDPLNTWSEDYEGGEFTVPANTPAGTYYVGAIAGVGEFTPDALTYNNTWFIPTPLTVGSATNPGVCTPSPTQICIGENRFAVKVAWRTSNGQTGQGQMIKYTPDSGLTWFFGPENIEMLTKVVNACVPTFGNKYWFFAAATTDVEYTITVTDSKTGRVKTYFHGAGTPAPAITDTGAFDCN